MNWEEQKHTAALWANDGDNSIGETALGKPSGCHEVFEPFHVELSISINQLHAFLHFHHRSNSKNSNFFWSLLSQGYAFFSDCLQRAPKKKWVSNTIIKSIDPIRFLRLEALLLLSSEVRKKKGSYNSFIKLVFLFLGFERLFFLLKSKIIVFLVAFLLFACILKKYFSWQVNVMELVSRYFEECNNFCLSWHLKVLGNVFTANTSSNDSVMARVPLENLDYTLFENLR